MPIYAVPPPLTESPVEVKQKEPEKFKTLHRWWYCGKKFMVNEKEYLYLEAAWEYYEGELTSVIKFTDGKQRFTMDEAAFWAKEKRFYDRENRRY